MTGSSEKSGFKLIILTGLALIIGLFGGLAAWSVFAPLESAAMAYGSVGVEGRRKTVQHLEGGIVSRILVTKGTRVTRGQELVRIDDTRVRALLRRLRNRYREASALKHRLRAERSGWHEISFPAWLVDGDQEGRAETVMQDQRTEFRARRALLDGRIAVRREQIARLGADITGMNKQIFWADRQIALINDEVAVVRDLVAKGLGRRPRLLALERAAANLKGRRANGHTVIAKSKRQTREIQLQISEMKLARQDDVAGQLRRANADLSELHDRITAVEDEFRRTVIRAPVTGAVMDLRVVTEGAVVPPGGAILDVVPSDTRLIIEARIRPEDIEVVSQGLTAEVRRSAYDRRSVPTLPATVIGVSADRLTDDRTGQSYYSAQLALSEDISLKDMNIRLQPGMPVEVMIKTGRQSLAGYLLKPIAQSFTRSLREQ